MDTITPGKYSLSVNISHLETRSATSLDPSYEIIANYGVKIGGMRLFRHKETANRSKK